MSSFFSVPNFNSLSCQLDNFTFKFFYTIILYSATKKTNVVFPSRSRFPLKLICCIVFGSASSACFLLKSITIRL